MAATLPVLLVSINLIGHAQMGDRDESETPNVVIQWDNAALQGVRDSKIGSPMVALALAIVHTCIYAA